MIDHYLHLFIEVFFFKLYQFHILIPMWLLLQLHLNYRWYFDCHKTKVRLVQQTRKALYSLLYNLKKIRIRIIWWVWMFCSYYIFVYTYTHVSVNTKIIWFWQNIVPGNMSIVIWDYKQPSRDGIFFHLDWLLYILELNWTKIIL